MKKLLIFAAALISLASISAAGCNERSTPTQSDGGERVKTTEETPCPDGGTRDRMPYKKPKYDFIIPEAPRGGREKSGRA